MTQLDKVDALLKAALKLQKETNAGTQSETINLLASSKDKEKHEVKAKENRQQASEVLGQLGSLIDMIEPRVKLQKKVEKNGAGMLKDLCGMTNASAHYQTCIEQICDDLLETADKQIDNIKHQDKQIEVVTGMRGQNDRRMRTENALKKPQHAWIRDIDNSYNSFIPMLTKKEHYWKKQTLEAPILEMQRKKAEKPDEFRCLINFGDHKKQLENEDLPNPYEDEIKAFDNCVKANDEKKAAGLSVPTAPTPYKTLQDTPFTYVDTEELLEEMVGKLSEATEIAVDLEHHNMRTYLGVTCLMQISTREEDWIVDTIALRKTLGDALRSVFDDPKIVKVLHGADSDVEWLQRDFGLYLVNMFDTGQAARTVGHKQFGLAYLLQHYCQVLADKKYQLADWRVRPLPEEMQKYAREDTHYLLYIYDRIRMDLSEEGVKRNALNPKALLRSTYHKSSGLCLNTYRKPTVKDYSFFKIIEHSRHTHSTKQLNVLRTLLKWRDFVARTDDESPHHMLPNHILFSIAKEMPSTKNELRDCRRSSAEPPALQKYQDQLLALIAKQLSKSKERAVEAGKKFNIDFRNQAMPEPKKLIKAPVRTKPACETVFRLDRTLTLPTIRVTIDQPGTSSKAKSAERKSKKAKEIPSGDENVTSKVFGPINQSKVPQQNKERLQKVLAEFPQQRSKRDDTCMTVSQWQSTFAMLTGFKNVTIDQASTEKLTSTKSDARPSFIEKILGKRTSRQSVASKKDDLDSIVTKVVTEDANPDMITFDKPAKKRRDPSELPKSLVERFDDVQLSSRQKRRLQHSQKRQADSAETGDAKVRDSNSNHGDSGKPADEDMEEKKTNKWEEIYGATSGKVNMLIKKQSQGLIDREKKKKKKVKGASGGMGGGNKRFRLKII